MPKHKTLEDRLFFERAVKDIQKHGYSLVITSTNLVNSDGTRSNGYFSQTEKSIRVAGNSPDWFGIFLHEYCHFRQCITNSKIWQKAVEYDGFYLWVAGDRSIPLKHLNKYFLSERNLELDCEKRTANLIKKYRLSISLDKYIQIANAYIYYFSYLKKYRKWFTSLGPTNCKCIYQKLPVVFLRPAEYNAMPPEYEHQINTICFHKKETSYDNDSFRKSKSA